MKYFLVVLAFVVTNALAITPVELVEGNVVKTARCGERTCLFMEYEGKQYMVVGDVSGGNFEALEIHVLEGDVPKKVWDIRWRHT